MMTISKRAWLVVLIASVQACLLGQDGPVLDETVKTMHFEALTYPLAARFAHIQGNVVVRARLDDQGRVTSSEAVSGAKGLIPECLSNSKKWRFQPNPQKTVFIIYRFKFEGLCNQPCSSQFLFEPPNMALITIGEPVVDHSAQQ